MSEQPQTTGGPAEEVRLNLLPGSGEEQNHRNQAISQGDAASGCSRGHYRRLAICSLVCGLSCVGYKALIYSVKAEEAADRQKAARFSKRAKKFGIISIVLWLSLLASIPILMALVSYLLTLQD